MKTRPSRRECHLDLKEFVHFQVSCEQFSKPEYDKFGLQLFQGFWPTEYNDPGSKKRKQNGISIHTPAKINMELGKDEF